MSRGLALVLCLIGMACTGDGGVDHRVTLEVRDGWIREPGTECAGSRPFLYVHSEAAFRVERSSNGDVVARGRLPEGKAVEALREDLDVARVPTFCRFRFTLTVPRTGDFRFVLEEGQPLEFSVGAAPSDVTLILP